MTNDLTTLSGALLEMKDELIYQLGQKGVTASYSSTDGLLGLIGEISNIQQGGGNCYHIELDNSAYTTTGSLTVTATLQNQYQPYANQTVTFTGGTSTVTATTNSNGVATATVTFSASGTLTATFSNVSDTATVTVQVGTVYYESALTSDDGKWQKSSSSGMSISYDSTNGCTVTGTTTSDRTYYINTSSVTIPNSDIVVEFDMTGATLGAYNNSTELVVHNAKILLENANIECRPMNNNEDRTVVVTNPSYPLHFKFEITSSQIKVYYADTLQKTITPNSSYRRIGFKTYNQRGASMKNLKVYELI